MFLSGRFGTLQRVSPSLKRASNEREIPEMWTRHTLILIGVTIICLVGAAGCTTPAVTNQGGSAEPGSNTATPTKLAQVQGQSVDVTPVPAGSQPSGQTEPGAGAAGGGTSTEPAAQATPGNMIVYTDSTYNFSVS